MDVELPLEILASDVGQPREPGRLARRVEQAVQPAELEDGPPDQVGQTLIVPDVHGDSDGAVRKGRSDLGRDGFPGHRVDIRHNNVRPFLGEPPRGGPSDATPTPDHDGDVPREQQRRTLSRVLLFQLTPLQGPVLEREHFGLRNELERLDRFRVRDRLEHRPVAQIGRHRTPLVAARRDHPQPRYEHDFGPVVQRALPCSGVAPVILLVVRPLPRDLGADRVGQLIRRRREVEVEPERQTTGPQDVLRRRHPARDQRRQALRCEGREDAVGVVEIQDHPASLRRREGAAHDRQDELRTPPT